MRVRIENEPRVVISLSMKEATILRELFGSSNSRELYKSMLDGGLTEEDIEVLYDGLWEDLVNTIG